MTDSTDPLARLAAPRGNYPHYRRAGDFIYVSGPSSRRPDNSIAGATAGPSGTLHLDIHVQTRAVLEKLVAVLAAAEASLGRRLKSESQPADLRKVDPVALRRAARDLLIEDTRLRESLADVNSVR